MNRILACALAVALFAAAPVLAQNRAGMGASTARPVGTPWSLPEGVLLNAPIRGYSVFLTGDCPEPEQAEGSGDLVRLCLSFSYPRAGAGVDARLPVRIVIPAGMTFISESLSTQNGIVVKKVTRTITPGQTLYLPLYMMCLNDGRSGSSPDSTYLPGPVTEDPGFQRLFDRLARKRLPRENAVMIQSAVWALSEGGPVSASDLAAIDALPDEEPTAP